MPQSLQPQQMGSQYLGQTSPGGVLLWSSDDETDFYLD